MHDLAVYVKEGLPFAQDIKLFGFSRMFLSGFALLRALLLFSLSITLFIFMLSF